MPGRLEYGVKCLASCHQVTASIFHLYCVFINLDSPDVLTNNHLFNDFV